MTIQACCICSNRLDTYDASSEKPIIPDRHLGCCGRVVCQRCTGSNPRYRSYCPYCQISTAPSVLPQGLRDPPAYTPLQIASNKTHDDVLDDDELPAYTPGPAAAPAEKRPDALHFLTADDTLASLSLAYGIPLDAIRRANNLFADHLIRGRRTVLVPGGGESLSPAPADDEEDERKTMIRRFMVRTKCADYDVAVLYLKQNYGLEEAVRQWEEDERWEREHPMKGKGKASVGTRGMRRFVGTARG